VRAPPVACGIEPHKTYMKPLSHITVIDLTVNAPGPFCSMVLSDLGARVIKVEPPGGDPLRHDPAIFAEFNRGKESIELDLKTEQARDILRRLAKKADVVLEGSRPGVAKRLRADYPTLSAENPGLVYCAISGFGQDGPWKDRPAHDLNYLALSGYLAVQSAMEGRPWPPTVLLSDLASALYASTLVLAQLSGRNASGRGGYIDLSMTDAALSFMSPEIARRSEHPDKAGRPNVASIPHYDVFHCADGRWFSLGIVHEDHFWDRFCAVSGLNDLAGLKHDQRMERAEEIRGRLTDAFRQRSSDDWEMLLAEADVPGASVVELEDTLDSPQFQAHGAFVDVDGRSYVAQPAKLSTGPIDPEKGPPDLNENASKILEELDCSQSTSEAVP